jgi:dTDP-4-amino-4,6-dideoxygalactose transaminase
VIPFVDLKSQYLSIKDEVNAAIQGVLESCQFTLGSEVAKFEEEFAAYSGAKIGIGVNTGTSALHLALLAANVGPGDEVITVPFTFVASVAAIHYTGATPVLIDVDPKTYTMDPALLEAAITPRTKAIIPVHLFGQAADMAPLVEAANQRGIAVIEDAAQAIGCLYQGKPVGTIGAIGCFSFFPSKNLGAFGDAGFVTATDPSLAKKLRLIRTHGMEPKYYHHLVGANFRIDAMQAAVLRVKLPKLAGWSDGRRANAGRYRRLFADAGLSDVVLPVEAPDRTHIYNQFVIRVPDRDRLRAHLDAARIGTEVYYPVPFHLQDCFADLGYQKGAFPIAEAAASDSLALPIYPELTEAQQSAVVNEIRTFYRG